MPTCPAGHDSASSDFCDVCGMRIGASAQAPGAPAAAVPLAGPPDPPAEPCPQCGNARSGQFCEACGFDFTSGTAPGRPGLAAPATVPGLAVTGPGRSGPAAPPEPSPAGTGPGDSAASRSAGPAAAWTAVVAADRAYYDSVVAAGGPDAGTVQFPGYCPERQFRLTGTEMRIGRRSASRGLEPEIDLTGPPTDPGVSRLHAVLIAEPDGNWAVLDPGSENGTLVNGNEIVTGVRVPVRDGDRIQVGAWTAITIHAA
ncbi:MAG TPA: FHA domain-containing protein [Streptosporangiaceae bacterium]